MKIAMAYSPDTDDAFMVQALKDGRIDTKGYTFSFARADIQALNDAARAETYDVTAVSMAAYPSIAANYQLMTVGASVGDQFGPALVVRDDSPFDSPLQLKGKRIAVPGRETSAYFAALGAIGAFEAVPKSFLDIAPAVDAGDVDAGILIHELQMEPGAAGFRRLADIGSLWHAIYKLPLPLGANAIRRSLGSKVQKEITELMLASIEYGLKHREETLRLAFAESTADYDPALSDRYISMYVNRRSLALQSDVREALSQLIAVGVANGVCRPVDLQNAIAE